MYLRIYFSVALLMKICEVLPHTLNLMALGYIDYVNILRDAVFNVVFTSCPVSGAIIMPTSFMHVWAEWSKT